jgi:hypothetical protein
MEEDAVDPIVFRDGQQERCERRASVIEHERRLAIELVYFGLEVRAAGRRRHERGNSPGAMQWLLKIANSCDAPALCTSVGNHYGIRRQHGNERVEVARGRGLCERCEQALMGFWGSGKQTFFLRDILSRALKELSTRRLIPANQLGNVFVIKVKDVPEQQHRAFGGRETLKHHEKRHGDLIEYLDVTDTSRVEIKWLWQSVTSIFFTACLCRIEFVDAQPRDDRHQIRARGVHFLAPSVPAQPRLLHYVFGASEVAKHAVGMRHKERSMRFKHCEIVRGRACHQDGFMTMRTVIARTSAHTA